MRYVCACYVHNMRRGRDSRDNNYRANGPILKNDELIIKTNKRNGLSLLALRGSIIDTTAPRSFLRTRRGGIRH